MDIFPGNPLETDDPSTMEAYFETVMVKKEELYLEIDQHYEKSFTQYSDQNIIVLDSQKTHIRKYSGKKPYACHQCDKSFTASGDLNKHMRIHTGEKPYACQQCDKTFTLSNKLTRHIRTHSGDKSYACYQCEKRFSRCDNLKAHMKAHSGEKPYACHQCDKIFSRCGNLKKHMRTHQEAVNEPILLINIF